MAVILQWKGDGLSPGNLTTSSAGPGDTPPTEINLNGGSTATIVNSGGRAPGFQLQEPSLGASAWIDWSFSLSNTIALRLYFTPSGTLATNHTIFSLRTESESRIVDVNITGTGGVRVYDIDNNFQTVAPAATIVSGTTYRFEVTLDSETGVFNFALYTGHSTTPTSSYAALAGNYTTTDVGAFRIGKVTTSQQAETQLWDDIIITSDQVFVGPAVVTATITAGEDRIEIEPYSTVNLSANTLTGTVSSWSWTQLSGEPVSLTGSGASRTFVAPALTTTSTLTFQVTANSSITDTVTISIAPHLDWIKTNSGLSPLRSNLSD